MGKKKSKSSTKVIRKTVKIPRTPLPKNVPKEINPALKNVVYNQPKKKKYVQPSKKK